MTITHPHTLSHVCASSKNCGSIAAVHAVCTFWAPKADVVVTNLGIACLSDSSCFLAVVTRPVLDFSAVSQWNYCRSLSDDIGFDRYRVQVQGGLLIEEGQDRQAEFRNRKERGRNKEHLRKGCKPKEIKHDQTIRGARNRVALNWKVQLWRYEIDKYIDDILLVHSSHSRHSLTYSLIAAALLRKSQTNCFKQGPRYLEQTS